MTSTEVDASEQQRHRQTDASDTQRNTMKQKLDTNFDFVVYFHFVVSQIVVYNWVNRNVIEVNIFTDLNEAN